MFARQNKKWSPDIEPQEILLDKLAQRKEKDIQRQKEIQEMFPDFKFKRIKQKY